MFGFGVYFGEDDLWVVFGDLFIDWTKHFARATPFGPPVDKNDVVLADDVVDGLGADVDCGHVSSLFGLGVAEINVMGRVFTCFLGLSGK